MNYHQYSDDPDRVLADNNAKVLLEEACVDGTEIPDPFGFGPQWYLSWKHGVMCFAPASLPEKYAKLQGALFIHLYLRGVDPGEANEIAYHYAHSRFWFETRQRVYQLRGVGYSEQVIFSERLWYSEREADATHIEFAHFCLQRGGLSMYPVHVTTIPLELRSGK
jgi:hypothetical protein